MQEVGILMAKMMKKFFRGGKNFLKRKQNNVLSAAFVMMVAVLISRFLGLLRDRLLAYFFSPDELGIYFAAFRIPDMVFSILVMGALTSAFVPVITEYLVKEKREEAWEIASSIINISLIMFFLLAIFIFVFTYQLAGVIAPGFTQNELRQVSSFTRIMLLAQFFFIISNFLTGILQSEKHFLTPALAPIVYNLGIITGTLILGPKIGLYGPTLGVLLGAFLHFLIQLPQAKELGFFYKLKINLDSIGVKKVWRLMVPRTLGLIASQINFTIDNILSSLISPSAITIFNFASHLQQLPVGLFGATIAQASLPTLSEAKTKENLEDFRNTIISSFLEIIFLTLPSVFVFIVLRIPLVRLIFGAVKFDWQATVLTGLTLAFLSLGVIFQSLTHLLARGFYSILDSKTPLFVSLTSVGVNIILSIFLIYFLKLPIWGLAISSSLADLVNVSLLFFFLNKKIGGLFSKRVIISVGKTFLSSLFMAIGIYFSMKVFDIFILDTTRTINLLFLTFSSLTFGFIIFIYTASILKIEELLVFSQLLGKIKKVFEIFDEASVEVIGNGKGRG